MAFDAIESARFRTHLMSNGYRRGSANNKGTIADRLMFLHDKQTIACGDAEELARSICQLDVCPKTFQQYVKHTRIFPQYLNEVKA